MIPGDIIFWFFSRMNRKVLEVDIAVAFSKVEEGEIIIEKVIDRDLNDETETTQNVASLNVNTYNKRISRIVLHYES